MIGESMWLINVQIGYLMNVGCWPVTMYLMVGFSSVSGGQTYADEASNNCIYSGLGSVVKTITLLHISSPTIVAFQSCKSEIKRLLLALD